MVDRTSGLQYQTGQGYSALDAQAARDRLDGYAVVSGLGVSPGGSLSVDVAAGEALVGGTTVSPGSVQNVSLTAADSTNPRKDTIYIDDTGTAQVETGAAETPLPEGNARFNTFQPEPPRPGTDGTILAEVWVAAGASSLSSADVRDRRQPADVVGGAGVFESVSTGVLNNNRIYASAQSGSDPDTRLDNALNAYTTGDIVIVERQAEYTDDRTLPMGITITSQAAGTTASSQTVGSEGTIITGTWTVDSNSKIEGIRTNGGQLTISDTSNYITDCRATIQVNSDNNRLNSLFVGDVTFASGTSGNIIDSCSLTTITDNGSNTVGDIG